MSKWDSGLMQLFDAQAVAAEALDLLEEMTARYYPEGGTYYASDTLPPRLDAFLAKHRAEEKTVGWTPLQRPMLNEPDHDATICAAIKELQNAVSDMTARVVRMEGRDAT